mmetsp:Transcript_1793/g.4220  ORF Transcript_1793/g.4220 Transcript_1793/m.4220 type:complete len:237 (+) Transcript_1793:1188-1898(+)
MQSDLLVSKDGERVPLLLVDAPEPDGEQADEHDGREPPPVHREPLQEGRPAARVLGALPVAAEAPGAPALGVAPVRGRVPHPGEVLRQAEEHGDARGEEPGAEAERRMEDARDDGGEERAEVDPAVEDEEGRALARVPRVVHGADLAADIGLERAAPDGDKRKRAEQGVGGGREEEVPERHERGAGHHRAAAADVVVRHKAAGDGHEVRGACVQAVDSTREDLWRHVFGFRSSEHP